MPPPQSDDSSNVNVVKKRLLSRLLEGVKGCQSRFGSRTELATEDDRSVRLLCEVFEDIFLHGLKVKKPQNWLSSAFIVSPSEVTFWPLIKSQLSKHESDRFLLLHNVRTDWGRSKAWLRAALNEHSLERYILIIFSLDNLSDFYEPWAFLRDPELTSILPQTAAGLGSVLFALIVDNPSLDKLERSMDKEILEPVAVTMPEVGEEASPTHLAKSMPGSHHGQRSDDPSCRKIKKKKKKTPTAVESFDDADTGSPISQTPVPNAPESVSVNATATSTDNKSSTKKTSDSAHHGFCRVQSAPRLSVSSNQEIDIDVVSDEEIRGKTPIPIINHRGRSDKCSQSELCSQSIKSDCLSVYSDCSDRLDDISLSGVSLDQRLKPVTGSETGGSIRSFDFTQDLIPVPSVDASDLHLHVDEDDGSEFPLVASPATPSCSEATSLAADSSNNKTPTDSSNNANWTAESKIHKLKAILDHEVEMVAKLKAQLAEERRGANDNIKILETRSDGLSKENEILKHQLKKYVVAVQLLKKDGGHRSGHRTSSFDEEDEELINSVRENDGTSSDDAAEYERKLIQVAEMHGELMEFNAHLQKTLKRKDIALRRLREELIDLRGPLAAPLIVGEDEEDDWDVVDTSNNSQQPNQRTRRVPSGLNNERILINIWIPSAFLTGATNDLHHVYQVFVRIKDTEWNVYRRYSQFYSLHRDLKKRDTVLSSFYFPPKKHLGNKDAKFVDERRRKLQDYLRKVINYTLQTNGILAAHPDKNLLISILPFFGEHCSFQKPKRERSRSRSLFFRQSNSPSSPSSSSGVGVSSVSGPQYTGL